MSEELTSLEILAADYRSGIYRLSPTSLAVLFYTTRFLQIKRNWLSNDPLDEITDEQWDTIQSYVDGLLYEAKIPMIGLIMPFATALPPPNVLPCDGSEYLREDFPELYAVLDDIFIVDDDHFRVPDLRGRTVIAAGDGTGLSSHSVGATGGEEAHQLDTSEMPSHSHTDTGHSHTYSPPGITIAVVAPGEAPVAAINLLPGFTGSASANLTDTGDDAAHNNMQPFYALNYGILAA